MPTTRYKTLRRTGNLLSEAGEVEANGGDQAIRKQLASPGFVLGEDETLIAVPVGNWTEKGAKVRTTTTFELTEASPPAQATLTGLGDTSGNAA